MKRRAWQALSWLLYHAAPAEWRSVANEIREAQGTRIPAEALVPRCDLPYDTIVRYRAELGDTSAQRTGPGS